MGEDAWASGTDEELRREDLGAPDYDNGLPPGACINLGVVFSKGLAVLKEQPAIALLAGLNLAIVQFLPSLLSTPVNMGISVVAAQNKLPDWAVQLLTQLVSTGASLALWPVQMLIAAGAWVAIARWIRSDEPALGALYTSVREGLATLLASLFVGLVGIGMAIVLLAPFLLMFVSVTIGAAVGALWVVLLLFPLIYVSLGLQLAPMAAGLDGLGPVDAMRRSWAAAEGNRLNLFVIGLVFGILTAIGMCLCCVPAIPVIALQQGGMTAAWLLYARAEAETGQYPFFERNGVTG